MIKPPDASAPGVDGAVKPQPSKSGVGPAVDFLQQRRVWRGGRNGFHSPAQARAKEQLFVFLVELENLQNPTAYLFNQSPRFAAGFATGIAAAQRGQRLIQLFKQNALPVEQNGIGRAAVLLEMAVFFECELIKLVTNLLMFLQRFLSAHCWVGK